MASNPNIVYRYELHEVHDKETLLKDSDHFISPDAFNKFRHAILDVDNINSDTSVDHVISSFIQNIFCKNVEPRIKLGPKREFDSEKSFFLSKVEPPEDLKRRLQLDIIDFVQAALEDANRQSRRIIQIRVILNIRKEQKKYRRWEEAKERDCVICLDPLKEEDGNVKHLPCGQVFHQECYHKWWWKSRFCPMCRSSLPIN